MCHPGRIGGGYESQGPVPVWARLVGGFVFVVMLIGFLIAGTVATLAQRLVRKVSK